MAMATRLGWFAAGLVAGLSIYHLAAGVPRAAPPVAAEGVFKAATAVPQSAPLASHEATELNSEQTESVTVGAATESAEVMDIRLHLEAPSQLPYAGLQKYHPGSGLYNSQAGQDRWVDAVLQRGTKLFVIESGALDGISHSNSIFFETERQWDCLLVEANPKLWPDVRSRNRKCHFLAAGLSMTGTCGSFPFKLAGPLGGFTETMNQGHVNRANHEIKQKMRWMRGEMGSGDVINVTACPLHQVLKVLNRNTVDYWSLDTEGSELAILKGSGIENFELGILTVEICRAQQRSCEKGGHCCFLEDAWNQAGGSWCTRRLLREPSLFSKTWPSLSKVLKYAICNLRMKKKKEHRMLERSAWAFAT